MCGITGIFNRNGDPVAPDVLGKMTRALAHRGPDGEGIHIAGCLGLGHRRLAILDLSDAGRQPMTTPDGRYTISYNGEVYNFSELRAELEDKGRSFRSRTDTEVVLQACAEWGIEGVSRFNGMFAFALWDHERRELFLARDRYGVKPLYYTESGPVFLFASEIKAILMHPAYRVALDREALAEYLTFQNFFTDRTLFAGVRILPAGTWLKVSADSLEAGSPRRYWDYDFSEPENPQKDEMYSEELDRLLRQAVKRQLVSDVEVGAYLSGGLDSGTLTAIAAKHLPYIRSFTCGFDLSSASGMELYFDERAKAEMMSHRFRTEHYEIVLKSGDMERVMPRFAWHLEEPRVGQSYPNFYVAGLASRFVKVVLSGTGGDEMFGGYPWRYYRMANSSNFDVYVNRYYHAWQRLIPDGMEQQLLSPIWPQVRHVSPLEIFRSILASRASERMRPEDYVNASMYLEAKTFLHGLLIVEDKLSMAHGLETRVPFLDNDLADFAMRLPIRHKLANLTEMARFDENELGVKTEQYYRRTRDGKLLLRAVMAHYLPETIIAGEKQGFSAPDASWFKGESLEYVRREILCPHARLYALIDYKTTMRLVSEHLSGKQNRRLLIWSLLNLEWWLRSFLP